MLKITAMISLVLIGSWAASLSCDSCGSECTSACGTRHFRSCCFNYLRKKRGPDVEFSPQSLHEFKSQDLPNKKLKLPVFIVENVPEVDQWASYVPSEYRPYPYDIENRFFDI